MGTAFSPELDQRIRPHLKHSKDSWRVDETYAKVCGNWLYLYRAVDSQGQTLAFSKRDDMHEGLLKMFIYDYNLSCISQH